MTHHGDCLEVMAGMEPESVDAIVTDPPYNLVEPRSGGTADRGSGPFAPRTEEAKALRRGGFMGKAWDGDGIAFRRETWEAAYRVAKPSAYLLAFGGTRTVHRMTVALEDAGWIIRDMLVWAYASGFPKSKASLKPAWEPIVMARKPGPLRMLAIDACRIGYAGPDDFAATVAEQSGPRSWKRVKTAATSLDFEPTGEVSANPLGRWPANVILTDPIFDGGWEGVVGGGWQDSPAPYIQQTEIRGEVYDLGSLNDKAGKLSTHHGDSGTYSRFFLIPKADRADREPVLGGLPEGFAPTMGNGIGGREHDPANVRAYRRNVHPTVKPVDLMRHLIRLVTPTGGTVLDPFLGSGTTAIAAEMEGFAWIGIEKEAEYVAIAEARLNGTQRGLGLPA